ncbi:hypothetical protein BT93_C0879 [Corymbia citriodora subsp. variegata]|nr:hypothetical protein BT93_C0879 [Corymbia citriodora subsp. variegata]
MKRQISNPGRTKVLTRNFLEVSSPTQLRCKSRNENPKLYILRHLHNSSTTSKHHDHRDASTVAASRSMTVPPFSSLSIVFASRSSPPCSLLPVQRVQLHPTTAPRSAATFTPSRRWNRSSKACPAFTESRYTSR